MVIQVTIRTTADTVTVYVNAGETIESAAQKANFQMDYSVYVPYINGERKSPSDVLTQAHDKTTIVFQKNVTGNR